MSASRLPEYSSLIVSTANGKVTGNFTQASSATVSHVLGQTNAAGIGIMSRGAKFTKNKNDQWSSAARVSVSKCTNPWHMTHSVLPFTIREPRQVCLNCTGL